MCKFHWIMEQKQRTNIFIFIFVCLANASALINTERKFFFLSHFYFHCRNIWPRCCCRCSDSRILIGSDIFLINFEVFFYCYSTKKTQMNTKNERALDMIIVKSQRSLKNQKRRSLKNHTIITNADWMVKIKPCFINFLSIWFKRPCWMRARHRTLFRSKND